MQDVVLILEVKLDVRLIRSGNHDESVFNKLTYSQYYTTVPFKMAILIKVF